MPKIWVDFSAAYLGLSLREVIEDPRTAMQCVVRTAMALGMDGSRTFCFPRRRTAMDGDDLVEVDEVGRRIGKIDLAGGLGTRHDAHDPNLIEDPGRTAFINFHKSEAPWIADSEGLRRYALPSSSWYRDAGYGDLLLELNELAGDRIALVGNCESIALNFVANVRGVNQALLDLVDDPVFTHAVMDLGDEIAIERGKFNIDLGFSILRLNDSIANMSVISPAHWREFIAPHFRNVCAELKRYCPEVLIYSHICGNTLPILKDLHEVGIDCVGPIDPLASFDCADARRVLGPDVPMQGGVNTLSFIDKSEEDLVLEAMACIEAAGRGAFVLGSGCSLPRGSKAENVAALRTASLRMTGA
jgi:hypothetical protein